MILKIIMHILYYASVTAGVIVVASLFASLVEIVKERQENARRS